jgi:hypothetical protein
MKIYGFDGILHAQESIQRCCAFEEEMMRLIRIVTAVVVMLTGTATTGLCAQVEELHLYPFAGYFTWREFASAGREVREQGFLAGGGGALKISFFERSLNLKTKTEVFGGAADYNGFSQRLDTVDNTVVTTPSETSVNYVGIKVEEDVGWRIPLDKASVEPLFGIGYRWWRRDIQSGFDAAGNAVGETVENWHSLYMRIGVRGDYQASPDLRFFAEGGAKCPFLNRNKGNGGITVDPGSEWSAFAELGLKYGHFRPAIFYEGFRFAPSPGVPVGGNFFVFQPKSESDVVGLSLGYAFR